MENASKAILIAGGILIAIITISIFFNVFSNLSIMVDSTSENTLEKELIAFNKSFEAYNKKIMYGTDIISVLNKAIDNNREYKVDELTLGAKVDSSNKDFYIDIEFTVFERDEYNQRKGTKESDAVKKTYKLSENYTRANKDIEEYYLSKLENKEDDVFRSFKFAGFKCIGVEYVQANDLGLINTGAVRKNKKNDIS